MEIPLFKAKTLSLGNAIFGGACRFYDNGKEVFLMLHQNSLGKPTVTRVVGSTIKLVADKEEVSL